MNSLAPPSGRCCKCTTRDATLWWAESATMGARGYVQARCEVCAVEEQLAHARDRAQEIPKLEARLAELLAKE